VLGASFDTPEENKAFAAAQSFEFRLLSDVDRAVGTAYEATRPPDDQYAALPRRVSDLIDPDGIVRRSYEVTDPAAHADVVLADLAELRTD
jgi:peroxiredoxin Q/BCP